MTTNPEPDGGQDLVPVTVNTEACITGGQCEMLEPDTFLVDDGTAVAGVIGAGLLPRSRAEIVIERCPGRAISAVSP